MRNQAYICIILSVSAISLGNANRAHSLANEDFQKELIDLRFLDDVRIASIDFSGELTSDFIGYLGRETGVAACWLAAEVELAIQDSRPPVLLFMKDATPREILDEFVRQRPEYVWLPIEGNLVNLLPSHELQDSQSWLNTPVDSWRCDESYVSAAITEFLSMTATAPQRLNSFGVPAPTRIVGSDTELHSFWGRSVTCSVENGTLLDVINAIVLAAGSDSVWYVTRNNFACGGIINVERFKTSSWRDARAYLQSDTVIVREAERLYLKAIADSPFPAQRVAIALELAEMYEGGKQYEKAVQTYEILLSSGFVGERIKYQRFIIGYTRAMAATKRTSQIRDFLMDSYQSEELCSYFGRATLRDMLVTHDITEDDAITALGKLVAKRNILTNDMDFQRQLEYQIKTAEIGAEALRRGQNALGEEVVEAFFEE